ncbi:hypothetical protein ACWEIJ_11330 [Lentzea sp. NPDC004789]
MNEVRGWIFEENLTKVVEYASHLAGYRWDDLDEEAMAAGVPGTDPDRDLWFEYPAGPWTLRIAQEDGTRVIQVRIGGDFDEVLAARLDTLLDLH